MIIEARSRNDNFCVPGHENERHKWIGVDSNIGAVYARLISGSIKNNFLGDVMAFFF